MADQTDTAERPRSVALTAEDHEILAAVDSALADGIGLKQWWERREQHGDYAEQFRLMRTINRPARSVGFFDRAALSDRELPVMGVVQEMLYDNPKRASVESITREFREFICRYFLHISDYQKPEAFVEGQPPGVGPVLGLLSWCADDKPREAGFGYRQLLYKRLDTGVIGKFEEKEERAIVDIREIGRTYAWLVVKVRVFNLHLTFAPFGPDAAALVVPVNNESYVVLSPEFITVREPGERGASGRFGFGYALLNYDTGHSIFAFGPGRFSAGFQTIEFDVTSEGVSRVKMAFVVNRPERILQVDIDPVGWTYRLADFLSLGLASRLAGPFRPVLERFPLRIPDFDPVTTYISMANLLTAGSAEERLCISMKELLKRMLVQHFVEHFEMIVGSLLSWRQIPDWLDAKRLPGYVVTGLGSRT